MAWDQKDNILYWADDLHRLARNLDKTSAEWLPFDHSHDSPRQAENAEFKTRCNILWMNAVEAGVVMFELCGLGAFDQEPRIKNLICQVRAELSECLQKYKVPFAHMVLNIRYVDSERSFDVYFVKIFEGICKVWAASYEDHRILESYYIDLKQKANLHVKIMTEVSKFLKSLCAKN